jgi:hypothetical protein
MQSLLNNHPICNNHSSFRVASWVYKRYAVFDILQIELKRQMLECVVQVCGCTVIEVGERGSEGATALLEIFLYSGSQGKKKDRCTVCTYNPRRRHREITLLNRLLWTKSYVYPSRTIGWFRAGHGVYKAISDIGKR